jgi:hypothetical protein
MRLRMIREGEAERAKKGKISKKFIKTPQML